MQDTRQGFELKGVSVRAGDAVLLRDLNLAFAPGTWTALVGPSGSGKTTLLRLLNRLESPSAGSVHWDGRALPDYDVRALRREVGLVVQQPRLGQGSVRTSLDLPRQLGAIDAQTAERRLPEACDVAQLDARLLERDLGSLSGGERQRVALARTLMLAPRALLLDEPTAALDRDTARDLLAALDRLRAERGLTLVAATHRVEELSAFAASQVVLREGRVVEHAPALARGAGMKAPIDLTNLQLLNAGWLLLVILAAVRLFDLGLGREYVIASVRTVVQLLLLGTALGWVFEHANVWLVMAVISLFVGVSAFTAVGRQERKLPGLLWHVGISLTSTAALLTVLVTAFVIQARPWWTPQYLIPLAGMIISNSMNAAALTIERLRAELSLRRGEIDELLALGASARQAVDVSAKSALRAALRPNLNQMYIVGLVSIPGTMTGQILAGLPPDGAARYQILVMLLWNAGAAATSALLVWLSYRRFFTPALQLRPELLQSP